MLHKSWIIALWCIFITTLCFFSNSPKFVLNKLQKTSKGPSFLPLDQIQTPSTSRRKLEVTNSTQDAQDSEFPVNMEYINFLLMGTSLFGTWEANSSSQISDFKSNNGFSFFNYPIESFFDDAFGFNLRVFDGPYIDGDFVEVSFLIDLGFIDPAGFSAENSSLTVLDNQVYVSTGSANSITIYENAYYVNFTINFIDLRTNQPFVPSYDYEADVGYVGLQFSMASSNISLAFQTSQLNYDSGFGDAESAIYALLMTLAAIGQGIVCSLLVKAAERGDPSTKKMALGTLRIINSFDFYLCLTGLDKFVTSTTVTGILGLTALPYGILALHYEFLLILHISNVQMQLPSEEAQKIKSANCIWLFFSLGSIITSVSLNDPIYIYLTFALSQVPQIIQNFLTGRKCRLHFWILVPLSMPKLAYLGYVLNDENNLFRVTPRPALFSLIISLFFMQLVILCIQTRVRLFRTKKEGFYQFHNESDKEVVADACSICLETLQPEVQQVEQSQEEGKDKSLLTQTTSVNTNIPKSQIITTPCKHQFHEECLRSWTKHKYDCPCCRCNLPALPGDDDE